MRKRINFFGNSFEGKILSKKPPEIITKLVCSMGAVPMMPDGTMSTHYYHTINKGSRKPIPCEVFKNKKDEKRS
jgi:hypothetical protein